MTQNEDKEEHSPRIQHIFTYGTLRDDLHDDDKTCAAPWTREFVAGCRGFDAIVRGFKMLTEPGMGYPFAHKTLDSKDILIGRVLYWSSNIFDKKLSEADTIEGYQPDSKHSLFKRVVVTAQYVDRSEKKQILRNVDAYLYYQEPSQRSLLVSAELPGGNWKNYGEVKFECFPP